MSKIMFTIEEISNYIKSQKSISDAIDNLNEDAILDCIVTDFDSNNYVKNEENLYKYEAHIGMKRRKDAARNLYMQSNGKKGKYWLACSPRWFEDDEDAKCSSKFNSKYNIYYWVNYGDDMTYGLFTVEQIIEWLDNPNKYLHEIGGTKET